MCAVCGGTGFMKSRRWMPVDASSNPRWESFEIAEPCRCLDRWAQRATYIYPTTFTVPTWST